MSADTLSFLSGADEHKSSSVDTKESTLNNSFVPAGVSMATAVEAVTPNSRFVIDVHEVMADVKSQFQHIFIYTNPFYGRVMMLDNVIQCTLR